jgi:hypothetical protein
MPCHPCLNRVTLNIMNGCPEMIVIENAGVIPVLPKVTALKSPVVEVLCVPPLK